VGMSLALRWLVDAARARSGKSMAEKLSAELTDAVKGQGMLPRSVKIRIRWQTPTVRLHIIGGNLRRLTLIRHYDKRQIYDRSFLLKN